MLAYVSLADDFDGARDTRLCVETLTHLAERPLAKDSANLVLALNVSCRLEHLELAELEDFLGLAHLGGAGVLGHV